MEKKNDNVVQMKPGKAVVPVENRPMCGSCFHFFRPNEEQVKKGMIMACCRNIPKIFHVQRPEEIKDKTGKVSVVVIDSIVSGRPAVNDTSLGCYLHKEHSSNSG